MLWPHVRKWYGNTSSDAYDYPAYAPPARPFEAVRDSSLLIHSIVSIFKGLWWVLTLPFRVLLWGIGLLGRLTGVILGFALMVLGMALWAGPFFIVGIPLFILGLLLTLRCLG